jgi:hypothetical protein
MLDLNSGKLTPVSELLATRMSKVPSRVTIWRWTTSGCKGVVLEALPIAGQLQSTAVAVDEFFAKQQQARAATRQRPLEEKRKRSKATERRLRKAGLL